MTETRTRRDATDASTRFRPTMGDLRHSHPEAREAFGAVFQRGPAVTDGGRRQGDADAESPAADAAADARRDGDGGASTTAADEDEDATDDAEPSPAEDTETSPAEDTETSPAEDDPDTQPAETMRDLEHTPPYGDDVDDVWERGRTE